MALQTENLVMTGLGAVADHPPDSLQPPLADGIHLRWAFKRERGFPWYGFGLYRRPHSTRLTEFKCLHLPSNSFSKGEHWQEKLELEGFLVESDERPVLTDDFPVYTAGALELDLSGRQFLRLSHPALGPSCQSRLQIGFRWPKDAGCVLTILYSIVRWISQIFRSHRALAIWLYYLFIGLLVHLVKNYYKETSLDVTVMYGDAPLEQRRVSGYPGMVVTAIFQFDAITSLSLSAAEASVVDFCCVPVYEAAGGRWEPVPGFPTPMCLPVADENYPCNSGTPFDAEAVALGRVLYGPKQFWAGENFGQLHEQLRVLVQGGPDGVPMAERSVGQTQGVAEQPGPNVKAPVMTDQRPLDLVLLGALHPAVAQMVGLYWVDQTAEPDASYDYMIVAAHRAIDLSDAALVEVGLALTPINIDAWVVFNQRRSQPAPLGAPQDLRAYALPVSAGISPHEQSAGASNCVGLRWNLQTDAAGVVMAGRPVLYHLARAALGGGDGPQAAGQYKFITADAPVLVAQANAAAGAEMQQAGDWPPFALHFIDGALGEGWYGYRVTGVDIFGRHSQGSAPAAWHQWTPAPEPRPWYFKMPHTDGVVHPSAVRLLDKLPPPPPTGVEAYALDPQDPTVLQDALYQQWRATLTPAEQKGLVGLRVRWRWPHHLALQAPDAREFRIYYHPGASPPAGYEATTNWQTRVRVVGFDEHVSFATDAGGQQVRVYEIILPAASDKFREGLPLATSPAATVAYAHVGVSAADDKQHTADAPQWAAGHWGKRFGNEGRVGVAVKVFRVHREKPPPPQPPPDSEKVFATPADYHGRSFYTYRWRPGDFLRTHVFRALDEAVFRADLSQRPRTPLTAATPGVFPAGDPGWEDELRRKKVAAELNGLNQTAAGAPQALEPYRKLSNDALRVLAGLPGNERAFTQQTVRPLDPADPSTANRRGPDDPDVFTLDDPANQLSSAALRAYVDTLDGRSTGRYFYRAAYVDGAHNRGPLGLSGPPVWLPNVVPPRAPVLTKVLGGDRRVTLRWASNREPDLAEYRVYRADSPDAARDLRLMKLVHTESVADGAPESRPAEVVWADEPVPGLVNLFYRVAAVDAAGNASQPSAAAAARAFDESPPAPPPLSVAWTNDTPPAARATWTADEETLLERRTPKTAVWEPATGWLPPGSHTVDDPVRSEFPWHYRLRVRKATGALALGPKVNLPSKGA